MNILYLSCHSILEYLETKLFTEMGHQVFSFGSYINSWHPHDNKRPGYEGFYSHKLITLAGKCTQENLDQKLINWADVVIVMHKPEWIINNWQKMKGKTVVWRTIGQSVPEIEGLLSLSRKEGLKIVRYSPRERAIPGFIGEDTLIRFYVDEEEFTGFTGENPVVITVVQSMKNRLNYCNWDVFEKVTSGFNRSVYGPGNENVAGNAGILSYEDLKKAYRTNRVFVYTGTYPASYTLGFIEAMMTGIPVVAIGERLADIRLYPMQTYEVDKIIKHKENGICSENINELRDLISSLLTDINDAKRIGEAGRKTAIELFSKKVIKPQWEAFFKTL